MTAWTGLGWNCTGTYNGWSDYTDDVALVEDQRYLALFSNAFPRIRMITSYGANDDLTTSNVSNKVTRRWLKKVKEYRPDIYILYGTTSNLTTITGRPQDSNFMPSSYSGYVSFLQDDLRWAIANGVDMYSFGNEMLISSAHANVGMIPTSITRSSNVATATFSYNHGLETGDYIFVSGGSDASYRVANTESGETVPCTVINSTTITYPSNGSDGTASGSYKINWSAYEVVRHLKEIATALKSIKNSLNSNIVIQYSESQGHSTPWINLGLGDVEIYGHNGYGNFGGEATTTGYSTWKSEVDTIWSAFGSRMIVTEHNIVGDTAPLGTVEGKNCENPGFEEAHSRELIRRLNYLISLGMSQVYYFGSQQGQILYNTHPYTDYGNRYLRMEFRPIYNDLRNERRDRIFLGKGEFDPQGTPYWW